MKNSNHDQISRKQIDGKAVWKILIILLTILVFMHWPQELTSYQFLVSFLATLFLLYAAFGQKKRPIQLFLNISTFCLFFRLPAIIPNLNTRMFNFSRQFELLKKLPELIEEQGILPYLVLGFIFFTSNAVLIYKSLCKSKEYSARDRSVHKKSLPESSSDEKPADTLQLKASKLFNFKPYFEELSYIFSGLACGFFFEFYLRFTTPNVNSCSYIFLIAGFSMALFVFNLNRTVCYVPHKKSKDETDNAKTKNQI